MTKEKTKEKARNKSLFNRFLDVVERAGNKLPHPIVLFGLFARLGGAAYFPPVPPRPGLSLIQLSQPHKQAKNSYALFCW